MSYDFTLHDPTLNGVDYPAKVTDLLLALNAEMETADLSRTSNLIELNSGASSKMFRLRNNGGSIRCNLFSSGTEARFQTAAADGVSSVETSLAINRNDSVDIYHDNKLRFKSIAEGMQLTHESAPEFELWNPTPTYVDADLFSKMTFKAGVAGSEIEYASIEAEMYEFGPFSMGRLRLTTGDGNTKSGGITIDPYFIDSTYDVGFRLNQINGGTDGIFCPDKSSASGLGGKDGDLILNIGTTTKLEMTAAQTKILNNLLLTSVKSGANQGASTAAAGELWIDTSDNNALKVGT